jgi:cell wall assembly regulator SMI1
MPYRIAMSLFALLFAGCHADPPPLPQESTASENPAPRSAMKAATAMREHTVCIEEWLQSNALDFLALLNPPATHDNLSDFESRNDLVLPPEVRDLYLIHNGESDDSDGLFGCWKLLPLGKIEEEIELMGHEGRVPLFLSGGGDSYYIKSFDATNPDHKLYECWHEQPDDETVVADSLAQFLSDFCDELHKGQYVRDPDTENPLKALVNRDDL